MANFMGILDIHTQVPHVKINQQLKLVNWKSKCDSASLYPCRQSYHHQHRDKLKVLVLERNMLKYLGIKRQAVSKLHFCDKANVAER